MLCLITVGMDISLQVMEASGSVSLLNITKAEWASWGVVKQIGLRPWGWQQDIGW